MANSKQNYLQLAMVDFNYLSKDLTCNVQAATYFLRSGENYWKENYCVEEIFNFVELGLWWETFPKYPIFEKNITTPATYVKWRRRPGMYR